MGGACLRVGPQVARIAHQEEAGDLADHVGHALERALHRRPWKLARDVSGDLQPERGGVQLLLRQADRSRPDVLVGVEADLLEDGGQRSDPYLTVVHRQLLCRAARKRL